ncbi:hypothetical protein [Bradyrhizobium jicamae]|uniref:ATP-dependent DNA ligase n=1 Tax=Bradyrhizobium jicamae TaxID=280332 RepID=UPI001BAD764F|nr:hypothetical protein [Bradyrhizobium jicamae]MBR0935769.1 hypothetical protein [Bradyrhizobium jicamae]
MRKPLELCKPVARQVVPTGPDWIHKIKYDGYRGRLIRDGKDVKVLSRSGLDWTWRYPWIVEAASMILASRSTARSVSSTFCIQARGGSVLMGDIEIYTSRYEDEHGHPPAGRRVWIFKLVSELGHESFLRTGEVLVYEKALEVAI